MDKAFHPPMHLLITGASSGIGLALLEHWIGRARTVVAVSRQASRCDALIQLGLTNTSLSCHDVDLCDEEDLGRLGDMLASREMPLTHVVNCAGVLHGNGLRPEKRLKDVRLRSLEQSFRLNAFAPILLARQVLPLMASDKPGVFASVSARVGSIADNHLGGWYSYRAAKAAQNQLLRTLAIETRRSHPDLCVLALHPGTTDTPLSKPFQRNVPAEKLFSPARSAAQLATIIEHAGPEQHGRFIAWDGKEIEW